MENMDNTEKTLAPAEIHHPFSPSTLKRRELCPGSFNVESMLTYSAENETAKRGTKIHACVANTLDAMAKGKAPSTRLQDNDFMEMEHDEMAAHDSIITFVEGQSTFYGLNYDSFLPETRLSYKNLSGELYYGTCDLLVIDRNADRAYIYDWKTGFREVDEAANNLQGAAYALAASQMYNVNNVLVTFFNPSIRQNTSFEFDSDAIMAIASQIEEIIENCKNDNAPCVAGDEQCRYCLGALCGACPTYMAHVESTSAIATKQVLVPIQQLNDNALASLFARCKAVEKLKAALETELKLRIAAKGICAGYTIKQASGGREARDIDGIYSAVNKYYSPVEFMQFCTLSLAKLEKDVAKAMKASGEVTTEKAGKDLFNTLVAPFVSEKQARQVLTPPAPVVDSE